MNKVKSLGQVFTENNTVTTMLKLRKNFGKILEPSAGIGRFLNKIPNCIGIELDKNICPTNALNMDFFKYSLDNKFETIIGNPPFVKYNNILPETKNILDTRLFDKRTNLYLFFIYKCIQHLETHGELIFITPREFLNATSSIQLNKYIFNNGTITDLIDMGDLPIFKGYSPNCIIFRFEKDNFDRICNGSKHFVLNSGKLLFLIEKDRYTLPLSSLFSVKVGAVSGCDKIFTSKHGNKDFVYSQTKQTKQTKRMFFNIKSKHLIKHKEILLKRRIKCFDEANWWQWGRGHFIDNGQRIYVNCKTRNKEPFFIHPCKNYDGSILALFPKINIDLKGSVKLLNKLDWKELGFKCGGRFLFSQKALQNMMLPQTFREVKIN